MSRWCPPDCARFSGAEPADGISALEPCSPAHSHHACCNIPKPPTFACALLGAYAGYSRCLRPVRTPACHRRLAEAAEPSARAHAAEANATAGLAACEQAAQPASL
eukprot:931345-Prymnesium_polylepis.1